MAIAYIDPIRVLRGIGLTVTGINAAFATRKLLRTVDTPSTSTSVAATPNNDILRLKFSPFLMEYGTTIDSIEPVMYVARTAGTLEMDFTYLLDGVSVGTNSFSGVVGSSAGVWMNSFTALSSPGFTPLDFGDLEFQISWPSSGSSDLTIYALYLHIVYSGSGVTFSPLVDDYEDAEIPDWRPRIKPGAFWI
jgi:hypothetical protein